MWFTIEIQDIIYHIDASEVKNVRIGGGYVQLTPGPGESIPRNADGMDDLLAYFEARNATRLENAKAKPQRSRDDGVDWGKTDDE